MLREVQQQIELQRREVEQRAAHPHLPLDRQYFEVAVAHGGAASRPGCTPVLGREQKIRPAQQCLHSRQQFGQRERLGQVIVCAEFETEDTVELGRFGGQHQDGRAAPAPAQGFADLQTVQPRHHQVEDQQVTGPLALTGQRGHAVTDSSHFVPCLTQVQNQQVADIGLVFGNKDAGSHA